MNASEDNPQNSTAKNTHPANQPDEYVKCPYFPEHELRKNRLPYHLIKCQSHPRAPKLVACPFNYLHRVRPEDGREHLLLCEDRLLNQYADKDLPSFEKTRKQLFGVSGEPQKTVDQAIEGEEMW